MHAYAQCTPGYMHTYTPTDKQACNTRSHAISTHTARKHRERKHTQPTLRPKRAITQQQSHTNTQSHTKSRQQTHNLTHTKTPTPAHEHTHGCLFVTVLSNLASGRPQDARCGHLLPLPPPPKPNLHDPNKEIDPPGPRQARSRQVVHAAICTLVDQHFSYKHTITCYVSVCSVRAQPYCWSMGIYPAGNCPPCPLVGLR